MVLDFWVNDKLTGRLIVEDTSTCEIGLLSVYRFLGSFFVFLTVVHEPCWSENSVCTIITVHFASYPYYFVSVLLHPRCLCGINSRELIGLDWKSLLVVHLWYWVGWRLLPGRFSDSLDNGKLGVRLIEEDRSTAKSVAWSAVG